MIYGINEKVFIAGLALLFITVVCGGVFGVQLANVWLRFKREEMKAEKEQKESMQMLRWESEREQWVGIVRDQNERLEKMNNDLVRVTRDYENAKQLMAKVNLKGEVNG